MLAFVDQSDSESVYERLSSLALEPKSQWEGIRVVRVPTFVEHRLLFLYLRSLISYQCFVDTCPEPPLIEIKRPST
jgi:hypothetical protein